MKILYIMCGVAFAGKSTLAKEISEELGIPLVSQDKYFFKHEAEIQSWGNSVEQWAKLLVMCKEEINAYLADGQSVVFDTTNLKHEHRDDLRTLAKEAGARGVVVFLNTPMTIGQERKERNKVTKERHDVEQHYVDQAHAELEAPTADEETYTFTPEMDTKEFIAALPH